MRPPARGISPANPPAPATHLDHHIKCLERLGKIDHFDSHLAEHHRRVNLLRSLPLTNTAFSTSGERLKS
jgi:hypothetical protein